MKESEDVACSACGAPVKARGIKSHQRGCRPYQDLLAADGVRPEIDPPRPTPVTSQADVAAAIAKANGAPETARATESAATPFARTVTPKSGADVDKPPIHQPEKLDEISMRLGATTFQAGTDNRFDWCREFEGGPRHTFSRQYFEPNVRVLVDVYSTRAKGVEAEVKQKASIIAARNAEVSHDARWGYFAVVRDENQPTDETIVAALAGDCVLLESREVVAARRAAMRAAVVAAATPAAAAV